MNIVFRNFQPGDEVAFRELNEAWIVKHFAIEEPDLQILGNPVAKIIRPGGQIVMAVMGGVAIGCCALIPTGPGAFELGKMTVREDCRGMGAGKRLLQATIDEALKMGATRLYLESNAKLPDAVHLYESVGFRHLPPERVKPSPYARSGVYMELVFAS
jgi:putative acetyltransferase